MKRNTLILVSALLASGSLFPARAQRYVAGPNADQPRLKFADSLVSPNHECMVRRAKLNPKVRPVYVNGVPMGFC